MRRFALPGLACALAVVFVGCGPMQSPLPPRLNPDDQKKIDDSWDRAFKKELRTNAGPAGPGLPAATRTADHPAGPPE